MNKDDIKRVIGKLEPDSEMEHRLSEKLRKKPWTRVSYRSVAAIAAGLVMVIGAGALASYHSDSGTSGISVATSQSQSQSQSQNQNQDQDQNQNQNQKRSVDSSMGQLPDSKVKGEPEIISQISGTDSLKEARPDNKTNLESRAIDENKGVVSAKTTVIRNSEVIDQNNEISVPKMQLAKNTTEAARMMGLIVYQGRVYIQNSLQIDPKSAKKLIGKKLGRTKGNITEWSKQDDYAVELASTVGIQNVYTAKGYDKNFRIMTCEKINGESYAYFYECLNGITVKTGNDVFGKFKMENNIESAKYQGFDSWNNGQQDVHLLTKLDELNGFIVSLEKAIPYDRESLSDLLDDQSAIGQKFIYLKLKDGSEVQLRLFKDGYVYYNGVDLFFKVDNAAFNTLWNALPCGNEGKSRTFTFAENEEGRSGGFSDLPANYEQDIYGLEFKRTNIPIKATSDKGLMLKGHNRSDDLFMYISRKFGTEDGLSPNTKYKVLLSFNMATNIAGGRMGIGGAPGESVFVKAGIVNKEPMVENINGTKTINLDKGIQSSGGKEVQVLGTIQKVESDDDTYEYKHFEKEFEVTTNNQGEAWVIIGTDSGYEGLTEIYFTGITLSTNKF